MPQRVELQRAEASAPKRMAQTLIRRYGERVRALLAAGQAAGEVAADIDLDAATTLFIGTIGAVSVFKAVYIDKRTLKCACVGGSSNVPLGFVSLTENLMMIAMALWMGWHAWGG